MRLSRLISVAVLGVTLAAGAAGPGTTRTANMPAGDYSWYNIEPTHPGAQVIGYMIVECDGTIHGPYGGISEWEEFTPNGC